MGIFGFGKKKKAKVEPLKEKPDTLKPNLDEVTKPKAPEKPKPVIVKVSDEVIKLIAELVATKSGLAHQFLGLSAQVVELQTDQKTLLEEIKKAGRRITQEVDFAGTKLKLNKDYRWSYDGQGNFVGTLKLESKTQPELPKK